MQNTLKKKIFYYKNLSNQNLSDWLLVAKNCSHSWHTLFDDFQLKYKINNDNLFNLIIYYEDSPIAIFSSKKIVSKKFKFQLNILKCEYDGLFIHKQYNYLNKDIVNYFSQEVINKIFKYKNIDRIDYCQTLSEISKNKKLEFKFKSLFFRKLSKNILVGKNTKDFLESKNYNVRKEIKRGLENLKSFNIITEKNLIDIKKIQKLDRLKSQKRKILPMSKKFFEERINSKFYNIYIIEKDRNYEVIFINSLFSNFVTMHYTSQSDLARKKFLTKALIYKFINELKNDQYYILGIKNDSVEGVNFFKEKISNHNFNNFFYYYYISYKSVLFLILNYTLKKFKFNFIRKS